MTSLFTVYYLIRVATSLYSSTSENRLPYLKEEV